MYIYLFIHEWAEGKINLLTFFLIFFILKCLFFGFLFPGKIYWSKHFCISELVSIALIKSNT